VPISKLERRAHIDERHGAGESRDGVGDTQLGVGGPVLAVCHDHWMVPAIACSGILPMIYDGPR